MEKFPYVFDLLWDIKSHAKALKRLRDIPKEIKSLEKEYIEIHRKLREEGYSTNGLPTQIKTNQS